MKLNQVKEQIKAFRAEKKGNLQGWAQTGIFIVGALMVWAVSAITLAAFRDTQTSGSLPYNITNSGLTFLSNASAQLGTAGTILGVGLLLVIIGVIGVGGYMAYQKTR